jgi:hypothetical protein
MREPAPPTALTRICSALIPLESAASAAATADFIAAYGEDSYRSAVTCLPPELNEIVSAPLVSRQVFEYYREGLE